MLCINPIVLYSNSKKREGEKKRSSEFAVVPEEEGKEEESAIAAKNTKLNSYIPFHSSLTVCFNTFSDGNLFTPKPSTWH